MTFLAPLWLAAGAAAAAGLVLVHFFARRRPRPAPLPTARFVPDIAARAPSMASRPTDLLLLLVRLAAVVAIGLALARPARTPARRPIRRVVVLDRSRAVASASEATDSARAWVGTGDTLVGAGERSHVPTLSSGLIAAIRAASVMRDRADSLELVIVSPFVNASFDAATDSIRRLWPGRARLVQVRAATQAAPARITLAGAGDDPLRATVALLGGRAGAESRIVRALPAGGDSAFARGGGVLVAWPRDPGSVWPERTTDTVGAVMAGEAVVVAPFVRSATLPPSHAPTLPIAHWVDGVPAAIERAFASGCIRDVAIGVPAVGDLALRGSMRRLVDELTGPCGGRLSLAPADATVLAAMRHDGPLMPAHLAPPVPRRTAASAWLLALAALLLLADMALRPRSSRP